jgi:hypothetical protein
VVFGFTADENGSNEVTSVPEDSVYTCTGTPKGVWNESSEDFAVFTVDRPVVGRVPMFVRFSGAAANENLFVVGHPDGLPLKLAVDGMVKEDLGSDNFGSSLDAFAGNSGSPVINSSTGVVEGVHVRRPFWHYVASGACATPNVCSQSTGCSPNFGQSAWAIATRVQRVTDQVRVPPHPALSAIL